VGKHKIAKNGNHERVGAIFEEFVEPKLKAAVQCKLRAENFVLRKNQEENSDGDAQEG